MTISTKSNELFNKIKAAVDKKLNMVASSSDGKKTLTIFGETETNNDHIVECLVEELGLTPLK